jgi:tetratricopeptide (TPR) repeat protein
MSIKDIVIKIDLWAIKGRILNDLHRYDEAIVSLDRLLQLNPNHAAGWNNKGTALLHRGKYNEAITCFDKSMKLDPTNNAFSSNKLYAIKLRDKSKYYTHNGKPIKYYTSSGKPAYS